MKEQNFQIFYNALLTATRNIEEKYFRLPVTYQNCVYRERAYCYELYHQLRQLLPPDFPYTLSGEVNKAGHPLIVEYCGSIIPDFLVHIPGHMGENDNLVIVEVKTIQGANYTKEAEDLLKDFVTVNCMTTLENGYYRGIVLIFGSDHNTKKTAITNIYRELCDENYVKLLFHDNPLEQARAL